MSKQMSLPIREHTFGEQNNEDKSKKSTTGVRTHTFSFDPEEQKEKHKNKLVDLIATDYLSFNSSVDTPRVQRAYDELADTNRKLFEDIPVKVAFVDEDPYESYDAMVEAIDRTGVMKIFAGGSHPKQITERENIMGRAVHDFYGHYLCGVDFSLEGEYEKWYNMRRHYDSKDTRRLLFTEVVGQLCVGSHLGGFDHEDFEQRGIIAPDYWLAEAERYMDLYSSYY